MQRIENLDRYIATVITQAHKAEKRPQTDVAYRYKVLNGNLLFVLKCKYQRVERRIIWRLLNNLPRQFGLELNLCIPDPYKCGISEATGKPYGVISIDNGIDANYSIAPWEIFGKFHTIRYRHGNCTEGGTPHLKKLAEAGYDYMEDRQDWNKFMLAFKKVYGTTPIEAAQKIYEAEVSKNEKQEG